MMLDANSSTTLSRQLTDALREAIQSGELAEGSRLPPERDMCDKYGLSRGTVRRAVAELCRSGHAERVPRRGTYVSQEWRRLGTRAELRHMLGPQPEDEEPYARAFERFRRENPGVALRPFDPDHAEDVDIVKIFGSTALINRERVLSLVDLLAESPVVRRIPDAALRWFGGRDGLYAVPVLYSPGMLFYNCGRFDEAGLSYPDESWDWDALRRAAKALDDPGGGRFGFYPHGSFERLVAFAWQNGAELFDSQTGQCSAAGAGVVEAMAFGQDLVAAPTAALGARGVEHVTEELASGRFAMGIWGGRLKRHVSRLNPEASIGVAPPPRGRERAALFFGEAFAAGRSTEAPELTCRLIEQMASPQTLRELAAGGDYLVADPSLQVRSKAAQVYLDALEYSRQGLGAPDREVHYLLTSEMGALASGAPAAEVCRRAQETVNALLRARRKSRTEEEW